jgi:hypothetical protein
VTEIIQTVEQEKAAGRMQPQAYDDVMLPLTGAKTAQAEGDTESYKAYMEAAKLVVTDAAEDSMSLETAAKIILMMP